MDTVKLEVMKGFKELDESEKNSVQGGYYYRSHRCCNSVISPVYGYPGDYPCYY
jgi:hypothetical protein